MSAVVVWTKPACQQCRMVKFRLEAAGVPFEERDLTAAEHAKDLEYFRGLGFGSAPITEFGGIAVPGFMPSEIDRVIAAWREQHPVAPRCSECSEAIAPDDVHAGHGMCGSCVHNAVRSGWVPGQ